MRKCLVLFLWLGCLPMAAQVKAPDLSPGQQGPGSGDPLALGKKAMDKGDVKGGEAFFSNFVKENPDSAEAWFYLGGCEIGLKNFDAAIADFQKVLALKPDAWVAHNNLSLIYAEKGDWAAFDKERAIMKDARDKNLPGVDKTSGDTIDEFSVNGEDYEVRYFYTLHGGYQVRYLILHFGKDGKADHWIEIESLDVDQATYKQAHPKETAAGGRVYTMDTMQANGNQGLIKFYEGEPTYETVRTDAMKVLQGQSKPSATTTMPKKK